MNKDISQLLDKLKVPSSKVYNTRNAWGFGGIYGRVRENKKVQYIEGTYQGRHTGPYPAHELRVYGKETHSTYNTPHEIKAALELLVLKNK